MKNERGIYMSRKLVAYFSASGVTASVARRLSEAAGAELYEIRPEVPYTKEDLDWTDKQSRSTLEMQDLNARPALADQDADVAGADVVFVGFPVWWYREPSIIDSFLEAYDFAGKTIVPFATSGGSALGRAPQRIQEIAGDSAKVIPGKRFASDVKTEELKAWTAQMKL